jgi:hypothetical protein
MIQERVFGQDNATKIISQILNSHVSEQKKTTVFHIAGDNGVKQLFELSKVIVLGRKITNN